MTMSPEQIAQAVYRLGAALVGFCVVTAVSSVGYVGWFYWPWDGIDLARLTFGVASINALLFVAVLNLRCDRLERKVRKLDRILAETIRLLDGASIQNGNARLEVTYTGDDPTYQHMKRPGGHDGG